ncbi:MAG: type II toxin-antitoxin system VapB family antitoxin [Proteobacteria bacterium]|nr:type II toxin-antitoxin system VapB family antitoxin [Pseudomonadota bacterium]
MITIANPRAEKAARRLAKKLGTTISEAVAVACERLLGEQDQATLGKRRGESIERMWAENRRRGLLKGSPEERAKLADHRYLYGPDGLPK